MSLPNTNFGVNKINEMLCGRESIFFVGIGGVSMRCLASISQGHGYRVGGSDMARSAATDELTARGIAVFIGHDKNNIRGYDALVYTVAISEDNPEYVAAMQRGIPVISRADFLGWLMSAYENRIGVCGMHGKSTVTSMISTIFMEWADPTVVSGASLCKMGGCFREGGLEHFIFEACEYMDSFLSFLPTVAVVLNIDLDHPDYFKDLSAVISSYSRFLDIARGGVCVLNADDANVEAASRNFVGERIYFGIENDADIMAKNITYTGGRPSFDLICRGESVAHIELSVFGRHNVMNALAACATAIRFGIPYGVMQKALLEFSGADRRMQYMGELHGAPVYDDYAHHPTEITATLLAAREARRGRTFCVFQPHTYSRTAELYGDFVGALRLSDRLILLDIYAARENDTLGVSSDRLAHDIGGGAEYAESFEAAARILERDVCDGDIVLIVGAGNVTRVLDHLPLDNG